MKLELQRKSFYPITEVYTVLKRMDNRLVGEGYEGWRTYLVARNKDIKRIRYLLDVGLGIKEKRDG